MRRIWISVAGGLIVSGLSSCRCEVYECHCRDSSGAVEVHPLGPGKPNDLKKECDRIGENAQGSTCDFVRN